MAYALEARSLAPGRVIAAPASRTSLEVATAGLSLARLVAAALERVRQCGAAVVRREPDDPVAPERATTMLLTALEAANLRAITTSRGRIEDVRPERDIAGDEELRSSKPHLERPPQLLFLQCMRPADAGDEVLLADAHAAFRALAAEDPRAADLLTERRVCFDDGQGSRSLVTALVERRDEGLVVRSGAAVVLAPDRLPLAAASAFCAAHDRLSRLLRDPRHLARVRLERGDWLLLDNHRTLHARTGRLGASWSRTADLVACLP